MKVDQYYSLETSNRVIKFFLGVKETIFSAFCPFLKGPSKGPVLSRESEGPGKKVGMLTHPSGLPLRLTPTHPSPYKL